MANQRHYDVTVLHYRVRKTSNKRNINFLNSFERKGNYSATSNNLKFVHWSLIGGLLHLVQRGGTGRGRSPLSPLLAVRNVTAHLSTAGSVQSTVLL